MILFRFAMHLYKWIFVAVVVTAFYSFLSFSGSVAIYQPAVENTWHLLKMHAASNKINLVAIVFPHV